MRKHETSINKCPKEEMKENTNPKLVQFCGFRFSTNKQFHLMYALE